MGACGYGGSAEGLPQTGNRSCTVARADVRPHGHNQKRPPKQFCRYDTGSSVGNPRVSEGDLNPDSGEISLDRGIHKIKVT